MSNEDRDEDGFIKLITKKKDDANSNENVKSQRSISILDSTPPKVQNFHIRKKSSDISKTDNIKRETSKTKKQKKYLYSVGYDNGEILIVSVKEGKNSCTVSKPIIFDNCESDKNLTKNSRTEMFIGLKNFKNIGTGLDAFCKTDFVKYACSVPVKDCEPLFKLLNSCGGLREAKREVLILFASILRGYCTNKLMPYIKSELRVIESERAPIISVSKKDNVFEFLRKIMDSLIIEPKLSYEVGIYHQCVFPTYSSEQSLTSSAFYEIKHNMKHKRKIKLPLIFRDTSVLIDSSLYTSKDVRDFHIRNPRCTVINYGSNPYKAIQPIRLNGKFFSKAELDWDAESVKKIIGRFITYFNSLEETNTKAVIKGIDKIVLEYRQNQKKKMVSHELHFLNHSLCSLRFFLDSLLNDKSIDVDECKSLWNEWGELLMPGFLGRSQAQEKIKSTNNKIKIIPPQTARQEFENFLNSILKAENKSRFQYIAKGDTYSAESNPANLNTHWAYIVTHVPKNKPQKSFSALVFRKVTILDLMEMYKIKNGEIIINTIRKEISQTAYLYDTIKKRMNTLDEISNPNPYVLILQIDKLDFLDEGILKWLKGHFEETKTEYEEAVVE